MRFGNAWTQSVSKLGLIVLLHVIGLSVTASAGIEAVKGKEYRLTRKHGPWMIMVATFHEALGAESQSGLTPGQAADELVYELRKKGIPAYTFRQTEQIEKAGEIGAEDSRFYKAFHGGVCVLAGNYKTKSPDDNQRGGGKLAHRTLEWIKGYRPSFMSQGERGKQGLVMLNNGGIFKPTPGQKGPLGGAFLTINPMLSPTEVATGEDTRYLKELNQAEPLSLAKNSGKYTLVVATFRGNSIYGTEEGGFSEKALSGFGRQEMVSKDDMQRMGGRQSRPDLPLLPTGNILQTAFFDPHKKDDLAKDASELAQHLNREYPQLGTYVWHDSTYSVVTVGSFNDRNDSAIEELAQRFGSKMRRNPQSGQDVLTAELITDPVKPTRNNPVRKKWIFDPQPTVMNVPKSRR
ncbi:hypothetical protein [Calycomorphotria hydatis]|uniref:Uncharacterized protein n=1 Tax=Calycomorphotria hydatis TaxID=2528027 RepID=A0A517TBI0_9PLAN|nr:hypothetical protein [Calycomorphotria hydatis]QDT65726.1 hypothetical protein V22_29860 [Calycomorphotria hydatis]